MEFKKHMLFTAAILLMIPVCVIAQDTRSGEEINWGVLPGGSQSGNSTGFRLVGTIGQTAVGDGGTTAFEIYHGFIQDFGAGVFCDCIPGDANGNIVINILDIIHVIDYKFKSGPSPYPYATCSADVDCNCMVNILDIIYLIDFKFKTGPTPCDCSGWISACGTPIYK